MGQTRRQRHAAREAQQRRETHAVRLENARLNTTLRDTTWQHAAEVARLQKQADNANMSVFEHPSHWTFKKVACSMEIPDVVMSSAMFAQAIVHARTELAQKIALMLLRDGAFTEVPTRQQSSLTTRMDLMLMVGIRGELVSFAQSMDYPPADLRW